MDIRERALYHQIHPLKLATDIGATPPALYLLWRHHLAAGVLASLVPPVVASAALVLGADLERQKASTLGRYISRHMTGPIVALRLAGFVVSAAGAWRRSPGLIAAGLLMTLFAWLRGVLLPGV